MQMNIFSNITRTIKAKLNVNTILSSIKGITKKITKKLTEWVTKLFTILTKKPSEKSDYVRIGKIYLSKRFVTIAVAVIAVLGFVTVKYAYPWADGHLWTATVKLNSEKYKTFSGKAKIKDKNGFIIYKGEMVEGKIEGNGTQYDLNGTIVYIGGFVDSQYSGTGELYSNGVLVYKGDFLQNLYNGKGQIFDKDGNVIYSGDFAMGQKVGKGLEYNPATGLKIYYGDFSGDLREGKGTEYEADGHTAHYEGDFATGQYNGEGKLYQNGDLKYTGQFANGLFEGEGTLYDPETKSIQYVGAFVGGLYEGTGSLYDVNTKKIIYSGEFAGGYKKGAGESYDRLGSVTFNGEFRDDNIDYVGYIGKTVEEVVEQFGKESYRTKSEDRLILTYIGLDSSIIFKEDAEAGAYACEKFIMGMKYNFKGLNSESTSEDIEKVMGKSFSSINFKLPAYYDTAFNDLSIDLRSKTLAPSDKFLMDNYFIRFYYNANKTQIKAVEVSSI